MDTRVKKMTTPDKNMSLSYSLVWGKSSEIMRNKVEANMKYAQARREINVLSILEFIKEVSYCCKGHKHVAHIIYKDQHRFSTL